MFTMVSYDKLSLETIIDSITSSHLFHSLFSCDTPLCLIIIGRYTQVSNDSLGRYQSVRKQKVTLLCTVLICTKGQTAIESILYKRSYLMAYQWRESSRSFFDTCVEN